MRTLAPDVVTDWVRDELLSEARERPIVALTTPFQSEEPLVEPDTIEAQLGELVDVVVIPTGEATWALSKALPEGLDAYGGALRVWWPGLTTESDPYDHRLYVVSSKPDAERAAERIVRAVRSRARHGGASVTATPAVEAEVEVVSVDRGIEVVDGDGNTGRITEADVPVHAIALCLDPGLKLSVARLDADDSRREGRRYSLTGRLPVAWDVIGDELEPGDVVVGRIAAIQDKYALIELIPGARGIVGIGDVDHTFVDDISKFLALDEIVKAVVLSVDAEGRRVVLSVKDAQTSKRDPKPSPSLVADGKPFDWYAYLGRAEEEDEPEASPDAEEADDLREALRASEDDRAQLRDANAKLRAKVRSLEDRFADLERKSGADVDPLRDGRAFLRAVRVAYARELDESERQEFPLRPMRVGAAFLDAARALDGIAVEKIVEVAAQVACGKAESIDGREVHALGEGGPATVSGARVRERDGARAWRCSLQVKTPSARRLHWWSIPTDGGGEVEFASVGVHDDFSIPD